VFALGGAPSRRSIGTVIRLARGRRAGLGGGAAIVTAAWFLIIASRATGVPRINDFTTDLADPPAFHRAASLPANTGRDLAYPAEFVHVQQECCADLRPARLKVSARTRSSVPAAWPRHAELTITATDADAAPSRPPLPRACSAQDDIAISRASRRPVGEPRRHALKSRNGHGDIGTNATASAPSSAGSRPRPALNWTQRSSARPCRPIDHAVGLLGLIDGSSFCQSASGTRGHRHLVTASNFAQNCA
jgi:hypothetical protein